MRAWLNLRHPDSARALAFHSGLTRIGYRVEHTLPIRPTPGDTLITWNRLHVGNAWAAKFEEEGWPVLVTENATWGNDFNGGKWLFLARNRHNTAGMAPYGGPERWDRLGIELKPWRTEGETVILAQRGIGVPPTRMPSGWPEDARRRHGGRIRHHPGRYAGTPLEADLARCGRVITWGSGAALKALLWGIPVTSEMPDWIGEQDNTDAGRLEMLRRLAWAQWSLDEIASGEAFRWMLPA
jgi:hypothetical protein